MRGAGLPIEAIIEYVKLFRMGDGTLGARLELLREQREELFEKMSAIESTIDRISYRIERYERALETDLLTWDDGKCDVSHLAVSDRRK